MTTTQSLAQQEPMPRGRVLATFAEAIEVNGLPEPSAVEWQGFPGDGHGGKGGTTPLMTVFFGHAGALTRWAQWMGAPVERRTFAGGPVIDANLKWHGWSTRLVTYTDALCDWSAGCDNAPSGEGWFPGVCAEHAATVRAAFVSAVPTDPGETHGCTGPACGHVEEAAERIATLNKADDLDAYAKPAARRAGGTLTEAAMLAVNDRDRARRLTPGTDEDRAAAKAAMAATFVEPTVDLRHIGLTGSDRDEELSRDGHVALPPYVEGHAYGPDPSFVPGLLAEADTIPTTAADAVVDIDAVIASLADRIENIEEDRVRRGEPVRYSVAAAYDLAREANDQINATEQWQAWRAPYVYPSRRRQVDADHEDALFHNQHPGCPDCRLTEVDGDAGREEGFARWLDGVDAIPVVVVTVPAQDAEAGR